MSKAKLSSPRTKLAVVDGSEAAVAVGLERDNERRLLLGLTPTMLIQDSTAWSAVVAALRRKRKVHQLFTAIQNQAGVGASHYQYFLTKLDGAKEPLRRVVAAEILPKLDAYFDIVRPTDHTEAPASEPGPLNKKSMPPHREPAITVARDHADSEQRKFTGVYSLWRRSDLVGVGFDHIVLTISEEPGQSGLTVELLHNRSYVAANPDVLSDSANETTFYRHSGIAQVLKSGEIKASVTDQVTGDASWELILEPQIDAQGRVAILTGVLVQFGARPYSLSRVMAQRVHDDVSSVGDLLRRPGYLIKDPPPEPIPSILGAALSAH